jgi:hypothetical protein
MCDSKESKNLTDTSSSAFRAQISDDHLRIDAYTDFGEPGKKCLRTGSKVVALHGEEGVLEGVL